MRSIALIVVIALATAGFALSEVRADASQQVLTDGFEEGQFSTSGGLFYKDNREQRAGRVHFQSDVTHSGKSAVKLTVRPNCLARRLAPVAADVAGVVNPLPRPAAAAAPVPGCSDRAEVWEKPSVLAGYDKSVWYRFALRLDEPIPRESGRFVLAQWKREIRAGVDHDYSPFLALRLYRGRLGVTIETDEVEIFPLGTAERPVACKPGEASVTTRPSFRQTRALVAVEEGSTVAEYPGAFNACAPSIIVTRHGDLPAASSGWIDLVVRSQPGPRGDGHIEVIANGRPIVTVRGRVGHEGPGLGPNQYFKFGPYRSEAATEWSVNYDGFARGPRCRDVIATAYCPDA